MNRDRIYSVLPGNETPEEPRVGVYWADDEGGIHGPYSNRFDAEMAIADFSSEPCSFCLSRGCGGLCAGDGQMGD